MAKPGHDQFQQPQQYLPQLVQRNYLLWFLLACFTGIFGLIYMYFVLDDLKKLDQYPKPAGVSSTNVSQNDMILIIVLYLTGLGLIANYIFYSKKYGLFNDYLDTHPQKQTNLPSKNYVKLMIFRDILILSMSGIFCVGYFVFFIGFDLIGFEYGYESIASMGPLGTSMAAMGGLLIIAIIIFVLSGLCLIGAMIIMIYQIVLDYRWQEAMNERVRIIDPNAPMVSLF